MGYPCGCSRNREWCSIDNLAYAASSPAAGRVTRFRPMRGSGAVDAGFEFRRLLAPFEERKWLPLPPRTTTRVSEPECLSQGALSALPRWAVKSRSTQRSVRWE